MLVVNLPPRCWRWCRRGERLFVFSAAGGGRMGFGSSCCVGSEYSVSCSCIKSWKWMEFDVGEASQWNAEQQPVAIHFRRLPKWRFCSWNRIESNRDQVCAWWGIFHIMLFLTEIRVGHRWTRNWIWMWNEGGGGGGTGRQRRLSRHLRCDATNDRFADEMATNPIGIEWAGPSEYSILNSNLLIKSKPEMCRQREGEMWPLNSTVRMQDKLATGLLFHGGYLILLPFLPPPPPSPPPPPEV